MFKIGEEVVVTQCTTPGSDEFRLWCDNCIKTQKVLTVRDSNMWGGKYIAFKGLDWVLRPADITKFLPIMENE